MTPEERVERIWQRAGSRMDVQKAIKEFTAAEIRAAVEEADVFAFVEGAKWWEWDREGATMWAADQERAFDEAKKKYGANVQPDAWERIARLEAFDEAAKICDENFHLDGDQCTSGDLIRARAVDVAGVVKDSLTTDVAGNPGRVPGNGEGGEL